MNGPPAARPPIELALRVESDVAAARMAARALGRSLELSDAVATRFATAVSEVGRNAVIHAGGGSLAFALETRGRSAWLTATVTDDGPGIPDVDEALRPRSVGPGGTGLGLSRARRLVDELRITSSPDGTTVVVVRSVPAGAGGVWDAAVSALRRGLPASMGPANGRPPDPVASGASEAGSALESIRAERDALREERSRLASELEETNRGVVALYAELDDQAARLRLADEMKSRFLSRVSHELRTPINSVVALSRLLADRVDGDLTEGQATQVGYIQTAAAELASLVGDLLDLARIESGRVDVSPHEFVLESLFGGLRGTLRPLTRPEVELRFESTGRIPPLLTDEGKLGQIVRNFVSNALKFTTSGSVTVTGAFDPETGRLRISVADTGVGIPAEHLESIFEEFTQVPGPHQVGARGTGLGLSVSRGLATLLRGEVGVESVPGEGSTFWVDLPAIYPGPATEDEDATPAGTSPTILVVDDDPTARYLIRHQLAGQGFRIVEAATGKDGLARAADGADAVLLDLSMPDVDGMEVYAGLRARPSTSTMPVVVHTSRELTPDEAHRLTADGVVVVRKDAVPGSIAVALRAAIRVAEPTADPAPGSPVPPTGAGG